MSQINFSPGPSMLPSAVRNKIGQQWLEGMNRGITLAEISHRSCEFLDYVEACEIRLRKLFRLPDSYHVLWMQGGANQQFVQVPMNYGAGDYVLTGHWGQKALQQAKLINNDSSAWVECDAHGHFTEHPQAQSNRYVHLTSNETIHGIQLRDLPTWLSPESHHLVADMSSDIASRVIDYQDYAMVYAGTQKNLGVAGLTLVIIRDDFLQQASSQLPVMFSYQAFAQKESMFNTPPTFAWYITGLVLQWLEQQGGIEAVQSVNEKKAAALYATIDASDFYHNPVAESVRSQMNVPFFCPTKELDQAFVTQAENAGLVGLKGHRAIGGLRASIYNAMPLTGVEKLIRFMQEFAQQHG